MVTSAFERLPVEAGATTIDPSGAGAPHDLLVVAEGALTTEKGPVVTDWLEAGGMRSFLRSVTSAKYPSWLPCGLRTSRSRGD